MWRESMRGLAAGAAGTAALNIATYADMAVRGRPESGVPAQVAGRLAERAGVNLTAGADASPSSERAQSTATNRRSGLGALLGYATGLGVGAVYGALRPRLRAPGLVLAPALGLAAMGLSDAPAITLGKSDPRTWGAAGWLADLLPHLAYGLATAGAYELMRAE
jgi:hypothetical protein